MTNKEICTENEVVDILKRNFGKDFKLDLISLARYTHKLIPINIEEAQYIYSYIINLYPTYIYKVQLNCLKNMILERENYLKLSEKEQKQFNFIQKKGKELYKRCNLSKRYSYDMEAKLLYRKETLDEAYDYYLAGLYITQHNIFNYYLGKICYKNNRHEEACKYLETYIKNGGEKLSKSLLYLNKIYKNKRMKSKHQMLAKRITELSKFFGDDFEFFDFPLRHENYIKNSENKDTNYLEIFEQPKMSNNLKERLENIKNLILVHQDKKADKLILELEREKNNMNDDDRKAFLQFKKNKKLYRAKR